MFGLSIIGEAQFGMGTNLPIYVPNHKRVWVTQTKNATTWTEQRKFISDKRPQQ